ncbi:MAG TPA: hypothetical protein VIV11_14065, partial [Kofleriaceae bacterium]
MRRTQILAMFPRRRLPTMTKLLLGVALLTSMSLGCVERENFSETVQAISSTRYWNDGEGGFGPARIGTPFDNPPASPAESRSCFLSELKGHLGHGGVVILKSNAIVRGGEWGWYWNGWTTAGLDIGAGAICLETATNLTELFTYAGGAVNMGPS